jgi:hypothetical protein
MAERDKQGRSIRSTLSSQEYKRLDALFQAKALVNEMAQAVRMLDKFVADARKQGATWVEIGEVTGMTAQSAHQRWSSNSTRGVQRRSQTKKTARVPVKREVQERLAV